MIFESKSFSLFILLVCLTVDTLSVPTMFVRSKGSVYYFVQKFWVKNRVNKYTLKDNRMNDDFYDLLAEEEEDYLNGNNNAGYGALKSNGGK